MSAPIPSSPSANGNQGESKEVPGPKPELDVTKLHSLPSEQQGLYLLTYTTTLDRHVSSLKKEAVSSQQVHLKKEILQIIGLSSPLPTRAIRNAIGRAFSGIFTKGDRRVLFESVNDLVDILNTGKGDKDLGKKHAAVHCLGEIFNAAGDSAISLSNVTSSSLLRLQKSAQNHGALRAAIFSALGKIVKGVQRSFDEAIARDIWKQARAAASGDKAVWVQIHACTCLEQLICGTAFFDNINDFESLKSTIWKACEHATSRLRGAAAACLAKSLIKAYSDSTLDKSAPKIKRPNKSGKKQPASTDGDEDETVRPESPLKRDLTKLSLSLPDLLQSLSTQYTKTSISSKARAAIIQCYMNVLRGLDTNTVEKNFNQIAVHLLVDILGSTSIVHHRYRLLLTRSFVQQVLVDVVCFEILGETGQINAARFLMNDIIKNYPVTIKERPVPSKHTLTGALNAVAALIQRLGSAFSGLGDSCREAVIQVLQHPAYTVQIYASYCLRVFTLACPQQLMPCASICMNSLNRELGQILSGRQFPRRCIGFANGLAAVLSISPLQPLHSSLEVSSRVLSLATGLLKSSSNVELRVSATQVQVAWILIGGLMALGPNFVKIHLSQLLLLWKNALPVPLTKANTNQRQSAEISYLTLVRESALGSMLSFLEFNHKLVTSDVSKRLATMLQNTVEFLDNVTPKKDADEVSQRITSSLQTHELLLMVRRRILQCYTKLVSHSPLASAEVLTQSNILTLSMAVFAGPEYHSQTSLGSAIAHSAGNFDSLWTAGDNFGYGLSGYIRGLDIKPLPGEQITAVDPHWLDNVTDGEIIEKALLSPICGAREHDSVYLYLYSRDSFHALPDPPATEVVTSAITLFAMSLPLQSSKIQEVALEQLATFLSATSLQRDPGRRAAVAANVAVALMVTLKVGGGETIAGAGDLKQSVVEKVLLGLLQGLIIHNDQYVRNIASEALGRLCNSAGNTFTGNVINALIDIIVSNRDPHARAGCAMALGSIHSLVGGMAAGYHLKNIHSVLLTLCQDPHPTVHFWAIEALSKVADSAGLTFSPYVSSTLGMLAQLWTSDTHNEESAMLVTSNMEVKNPTLRIIAHNIDSLINVLGPDLQDMSKTRDLISILIAQFELDETFNIRAESLWCREHMFLYASSYVDFSEYVHRLQRDLECEKSLVRNIAIDGLYNLIRRDAEEVMRATDNRLEDKIWAILNKSPEHSRIRSIIEVWLGQTCLTKTNEWITRCQHVLTSIAPKNSDSKDDPTPKASDAPDLQDDEVAGFASSSAKDDQTPTPDAVQELLAWRVRAFAIDCLSNVVAVIGKDIQLSIDSRAGSALQQRIADVIRLAFLSSTSEVVELRVRGLRLIDQVLTIFGRTPDPDFAEALLLEQYQAQISSALTPAFGADSSPELASEAVTVCGTFIATGLVTDVDRMGRILKLLVAALQSFTSDTEDSEVGDLKGLSSNAQIMVKLAVLSAWAQLQIASTEQVYLVDVVKPHVAKLTPLWLESLQEFARLRFEPDISDSLGPTSASDSLDNIYSALNRQTLLKFYQDSWLSLVNAIASLIDQDSDFVFDALDGKSTAKNMNGTDARRSSNINYREEPVAFFFVLFGIAFEALMTRRGNEMPEDKDQTLEILLALKRILRPSVSGNAIYQDIVFSETMELFDRLVLTESLEIQVVIVEISRNLCLNHPSAQETEVAGEDHLSDDIEQLFELTRIIILVLAGVLPSLADRAVLVQPALSDEAVALVKVSLEAIVDAADIFPSIIRTDLHACIIHVFATILGSGHCQAAIVPQALLIFRRFIHAITENVDEGNTAVIDQIRGALQRLLSILDHAQRRETEASLPCAKNTLLASTILLTNGANAMPPNDPIITKFLDEVLSCLEDIGLAKVAANCMRSLLVKSPKGATDEAIARYLLPRLLHFLIDAEIADPEDARSLVTRAITSFVSTTRNAGGDSDAGDASTPAAISLVLPTLLARASSEGKRLFPEIAARILELAAVDQLSFRAVIGAMDGDTRGFMEEVIRAGGGKDGPGKRGKEDEDRIESEPAIALKFNFGGGK